MLSRSCTTFLRCFKVHTQTVVAFHLLTNRWQAYVLSLTKECNNTAKAVNCCHWNVSARVGRMMPFKDVFQGGYICMFLFQATKSLTSFILTAIDFCLRNRFQEMLPFYKLWGLYTTLHIWQFTLCYIQCWLHAKLTWKCCCNKACPLHCIEDLLCVSAASVQSGRGRGPAAMSNQSLQTNKYLYISYT
jgi:hypothetical protein